MKNKDISKNKYNYILVEYRDIGINENVPIKYLPAHKRKGSGRNKDFKEEYIEIARLCCRDLGADLRQLAKIFNCSEPTLYRWISDNTIFHKTIKEATDIWNNYKVEKTLIARALGIEYEEIKREQYKVLDKYKNKAIIPAEKVTKIKKFIPGDPSCLFFYLQNRNPDRWRNTKYLQIEGDIKTTDETAVKIEKLRQLETKDLVKLKEFHNKMKQPMKRSLEV